VSCGRGTTVKWSRHGAVVTSCRCRSWKCPDCNKSRRRQLRDAIESGKPTRFLTLTWDTKRPESREEARAIMGAAVKLLMARWRRHIKGRELEYASVTEATKRGWPHFHLALRTGWISTRWISKNWASLIDAPIVKIKLVRSVQGLAMYLSKYLSKDPSRIGTGKRYWFSQGYRPDGSEERAAHARRFVYRWYRDSIAQVVADHSGREFIPYWVNPHHAILAPVGPP